MHSLFDTAWDRTWDLSIPSRTFYHCSTAPRPLKFYTVSKIAKFWAVFIDRRPDWTATFLKRLIFRNLNINIYCADEWAIMSWTLVKIGLPPSTKIVREFGDQNVQKPKIGDSEAINSKTAEDEPYYRRV